MANKDLLLVICTVCGTPLSVTEEYLLLYVKTLQCPLCHQVSHITPELAEFILKGHKQK